MGFFENIKGFLGNEKAFKALWEKNTVLESKLLQLELDLAADGFERIGFHTNQLLSRNSVEKASERARKFYILDPNIKRAVNVKGLYTFSQGVNVSAVEDEVTSVIKGFTKENSRELFSNKSYIQKDLELCLDGNIFWVFFTDPRSGKVTVRTVALGQVTEIITNPEDFKEVWFYKKAGVNETVLHPDKDYNPRERPSKIDGFEVKWEQPIKHTKAGSFSDSLWGFSEIFPALDWAKAYKEFLEDWATIVRSYARLAWKVKTTGGAAGVAKTKQRLNTTFGTANNFGVDTNPPPLVGSVAVLSEKQDMTPIKTAGATTSAEDARRLLLMVASAAGIGENFFGDTKSGNLATAKSLEDPFLRMIKARQSFWADELKDIFSYVIFKSVEAPDGALSSFGSITGKETADGKENRNLRVTFSVTSEKTEELFTDKVSVDFPPVLEKDIGASVGAVVTAATLDGKPLAGTIPTEDVSRMLLNALGAENVEEMLEKLQVGDTQTSPEQEEQEEVLITKLNSFLDILREKEKV